MKRVYPVVITESESGLLVYIPDFKVNTEGADLAEAMAMARDAIGLAGMDLLEDGLDLPDPSAACDVRTFRRTVSLPSWFTYEADRAGINVSSVLQAALKKELKL